MLHPRFSKIFIAAGFIFVSLIYQPIAQAKTWELNSDLSCDARDVVVDRMATSTVVSISTDQVEVGGRFDVRWSRGSFPEREPIYLMISFDKPVRFKGENLYGLLPDATAGFEITYEKENTRAVLPFYGRGVPKSGSISVEPLLAGPVAVKWAVVGHNGCAQRIDTPNQGKAIVTAITSGKPEIVVNDPDDLGKPEVTYVNKDGSRYLEIFEGRFRLLDGTTGSEILNEVGTEVHFSPAGRYVVVLEGGKAGIFDAVDGFKLTEDPDGIIFTTQWHSIIWSHNDSFAVRLLNGISASVFHNLLTHTEASLTGNGCRICGANRNQYSMSLENNVLNSQGYSEITVSKLSGGDEIYAIKADRVNNGDVSKASHQISAIQGVVRPRLGDSLAYSSEIELSKSIGSVFSTDGTNRNKEIEQELAKYFVTQKTFTKHSEKRNQTVLSAVTNWRARSFLSENPKGDDYFGRRINEVGFTVNDTKPIEKIDVVEMMPKTSSNSLTEQDIVALDKARLNVYKKLWKRISDSTGVDISRLQVRESVSSCGLYDDEKILGEFHQVWHWKNNGKNFWLTNFECTEGSAAFNYPITLLFSDIFPDGVLSRKGEWGAIYGFDLNNPDNNTGPSCGSQLDNCGFEINVFGNLLLMFSTEALGYAIVDTNTGELISKQFNLPRGDIFDDVLLAADGKHTVSVQKDGTFFVNRLADSKTILSGLYADDEVIVSTEEGRYDATAEGAHFVSYKFPGRLGEYTAQQFDSYLRVPGLANQVMNGTYQPSDLTITPPPTLNASFTQNSDGISFSAEVSATIQLDQLTVFQDGLQSDAYSISGVNTDLKETIKLLPGTKWISLVATDENGVASAPIGYEVSEVSSPRRLHLLSIGVNDYGDPEYNLAAAVPDANLIATSLKASSGLGYEVISEKILLDKQASKLGILDALDKIIAGAKSGDSLAFYFAGHGLQQDGRYYLAGYGTDLNNVASSALPFDEISKKLKQKDLRIILLLDACQSGYAGQGLFATNDDVVESALSAIPSGIVVFAASKGREFALEDPESGHGFFAKALAEVIHTDRAKYDTDGNGAIEMSELFRSTKDLVSKRVAATQKGIAKKDVLIQTPWMARNRMVGDFALF